MRVLLVSGSFPPMRCGVGDYSSRVATALNEQPDLQVGVLTSRQAEIQSDRGGVTVFPLIDRWGVREIGEVWRCIRRWKPDVVHVQYPTQGYGRGKLQFLVPLIAFLLGKKVVQTWHGGYGGGVGDFIKAYLTLLVPGTLVIVYEEYEGLFHRRLRGAVRRKHPVFIANASVIPRRVIDPGERERLRLQYGGAGRRLVAFFGFVYPYKGVDLLFDVADPATDALVIAGEVGSVEYERALRERADSDAWRGKVAFTGYLSPSDSAELLGAVDAVVLPLRQGGGYWNTSILAAVANGAFVVTTADRPSGLDERRNVYFARIDDVAEMRTALSRYAGRRRAFDAAIDEDGWHRVAREYRAVYDRLTGAGSHQL